MRKLGTSILGAATIAALVIGCSAHPTRVNALTHSGRQVNCVLTVKAGNGYLNDCDSGWVATLGFASQSPDPNTNP
jgi:hypothetical protein